MFKSRALEALQQTDNYPTHVLEAYRDDNHIELAVGQEGFKEFFGDLSKSIKQISVRCSAWFRLRPPLTEVNKTRRALEAAGMTYDRIFEVSVPMIPNTKELVSHYIERLEEKEKILDKIQVILPLAMRRYSDYINRIDKLANVLPDASIWTSFEYNYDEVIEKDQSFFDTSRRDGVVPFGEAYRSLNDYTDCGQHLDALNARLQAHRPSQLKTDVDRLSGVLDRLHAKTKEHALPDVWKESIANDVLALAKWVEYYAITMNQVMQATLVVKQAGEALLKIK